MVGKIIYLRQHYLKDSETPSEFDRPNG